MLLKPSCSWFFKAWSIASATCDVLLQSKILIVVCSPRAVQSPNVAAEIRHFRSLGRSDLIIPALLEGEPGDPYREAFAGIERPVNDINQANIAWATDFELPEMNIRSVLYASESEHQSAP